MPIKRKYDFQAGTKISSSQVDEEFDQLVSQINQVELDLNSKDAHIKNHAQMSKITTDDGGSTIFANETTDDILQMVVSKGTGLRTLYAASGSKNLPPSNASIRGMAQLTSPIYGWVWCLDYKNQMWTNYLDNGSWSGWKKLSSQTSEDEQKELWSGVFYMRDTQTVTPSKKLSECQTGWILVWSDYDIGVGANDYNWAFSYIPKKISGIDKGGSVYLPVVYNVNATQSYIVGKQVYVNDDTITGSTFNDSDDNGSRDVCLRYVYEF